MVSYRLCAPAWHHLIGVVLWHQTNSYGCILIGARLQYLYGTEWWKHSSESRFLEMKRVY